MPILNDFEYSRPSTLEEAIEILSKYGNKAKILAGGTDLANMLKQGFKVPEIMIDIKNIEELQKIYLSDNELFIGSTVTFSEIIKSDIIKKNFNILWEAAHVVASSGIRNRATMVGNICSAVACLDSGAPLLVHDALVHTKSINGLRKIPIQQWFVDNRKTSINDNEVVIGVSISLPKIKYAGSYEKMMRYSGEDLSQANVGILVYEDNTVKVAFGSVAPTPKRSPKIENHFKQNGINEKTISEAKQMIETVISPITDVRATKEYRMHMTKVMFERGLKKAINRLKN